MVGDKVVRPNVLMMASSRGGGLSYHFVRLSLNLERKGVNVVVISSDKEDEPGLKQRLKEAAIKCYWCNDLTGISPWAIWKSVRDLKKILISDDIDVIHAQGLIHLIEAYAASKVLSWRKKVAIVQSVHHYAHGSRYEKLFLRIGTKLMSWCSDLILPVSQETYERLIQSGSPQAKTFLLHNPIDLEKLKEEVAAVGSPKIRDIIFQLSDKPVVIYPANLVSRKGHRYYLKAARQVVKEFPNAKFIVTSDGPMRKKLVRMSQSMGISSNVIFTGRIEVADLRLLVSRANIGAFPSLAETFALGALEMVAVGKPVVATPVGAIPEMVVDGVNGFLIPRRDPSALAVGILNLLRNPEKAKRMGLNGKRLIEEKFSMNTIVPKLKRLYDLAVERKITEGV